MRNMIKISRTILPSFLLAVILLIAGGFSDGMIASAAMGPMDENIYVPSGQTMHEIGKVTTTTSVRQDAPFHNSLKPCCENKQGGASAIQASTFNQNVKFSPLGSTEGVTDSNSIFEHKILELSSASPPKPDILSSVLKRE